MEEVTHNSIFPIIPESCNGCGRCLGKHQKEIELKILEKEEMGLTKQQARRETCEEMGITKMCCLAKINNPPRIPINGSGDKSFVNLTHIENDRSFNSLIGANPTDFTFIPFTNGKLDFNINNYQKQLLNDWNYNTQTLNTQNIPKIMTIKTQNY